MSNVIGYAVRTGPLAREMKRVLERKSSPNYEARVQHLKKAAQRIRSSQAGRDDAEAGPRGGPGSTGRRDDR